jgi:anthranilate phosphoribosyltransferase
VLAACGAPAVSHGVETMGPKYGVTHRQVLRAAGVPVDLSMAEAAARVADPGIGWCYMDQRVFAPKLHALASLRSLIVKRPALTTIEVLLGPLRGRRRTHLATGYVHKAYPRIYALLARHAEFDSTLLVRGVEGSVIPSLRQEGKYFSYQEKEEKQERRMTPADFGWNEPLLTPPIPPGAQRSENDPTDAAVDTTALAQAAAEAGRGALAGAPGPARDNLIAAAALCLCHLRKSPSLLAAAGTVRAALDSGRAKTRFDAART